MEVNIHAAKTHLSKLLRKVAEGEEVTIAKSGVPIARIVPVNTGPKRILGLGRGSIKFFGDFDAPLPDEVLEGFYGKPRKQRKRK